MLPKVPRIITSWLPRRDPNELKSRGSTPFEMRYSPAGELTGITPAGEMWSVVTESPSTARARAWSMSVTPGASGVRPSKKGGSCT